MSKELARKTAQGMAKRSSGHVDAVDAELTASFGKCAIPATRMQHCPPDRLSPNRRNRSRPEICRAHIPSARKSLQLKAAETADWLVAVLNLIGVADIQAALSGRHLRDPRAFKMTRIFTESISSQHEELTCVLQHSLNQHLDNGALRRLSCNERGRRPERIHDALGMLLLVAHASAKGFAAFAIGHNAPTAQSPLCCHNTGRLVCDEAIGLIVTGCGVQHALRVSLLIGRCCSAT